MGSRTRIPEVESQRTDVETMRVRNGERAQKRLAFLRECELQRMKAWQIEVWARYLRELAEESGLPVSEVARLLEAGRKPDQLRALGGRK